MADMNDPITRGELIMLVAELRASTVSAYSMALALLGNEPLKAAEYAREFVENDTKFIQQMLKFAGHSADDSNG